MTAKKFLRSKGLYVTALIADQNSPENHYSLSELLNEYAKEKAWEAWLAVRNQYQVEIEEVSAIDINYAFLKYWEENK